MTLRVLQFAATIPAGTPKASPTSTPLQLDGWELQAIGLEVPPGPNGAMGFYVANNSVPWIPQPAGSFIVWDDARETWPIEGQPNAGGWAIVGYNTGKYAHTVTVRAHVIPTGPATSPTPKPALSFVETEVSQREPVLL